MEGAGCDYLCALATSYDCEGYWLGTVIVGLGHGRGIEGVLRFDGLAPEFISQEGSHDSYELCYVLYVQLTARPSRQHPQCPDSFLALHPSFKGSLTTPTSSRSILKSIVRVAQSPCISQPRPICRSTQMYIHSPYFLKQRTRSQHLTSFFGTKPFLHVSMFQRTRASARASMINPVR